MSLLKTLHALFIQDKQMVFLRTLRNYLLLTSGFLLLSMLLLEDFNYMMFFLIFAGTVANLGIFFMRKYALFMRTIARLVLGLSATLSSIMIINTYQHGFALEQHFSIFTPIFLLLCGYILYCIGITTYKEAP